ncbi:MAG: radical SAM protein [Thermoanaerobaculia bacterium]
MKVLLIQPPIEDFYTTPIRNYPLGLLQIASILNQEVELKVLNLRVLKGKIIEKRDFEELDIFFNENKSSPFSLFKGYKYFGKDEGEIKDILEKEKPEIVGISSNFSAHFKEVLKLSKIIKKILPETRIVLGGTHPTLYPKETLINEEIDFVIRGEGETPFKTLIETLKKGMDPSGKSGICFKKNGKILLEEISFEEKIDFIPRRELIEKKDFQWGGSHFSQILTSRGCPFACSFCGKVKTPFRKRSLKSLEEEIEYLEKENIKTLSIEDEVLGIDENFFREVLKIFKGKNFNLYCMNGIYPEILKKELLKEMLEAGFQKLNLSLVDISEETLRREKRPFFKISEKLKEVEDFPLNYEVHFIVGLPNQKIEDLLQILLYLCQKRVLIAPSVYYLAPFSSDFKKYYKGEDFKYFRSSALHSPNPQFSPCVLYTFLILSRFINFIKNALDRYKIKSFSEIKEILKSDRDKIILEKLLQEKKFYFYDKKREDFFEEPQDEEIVKTFFNKFKKIKGFKSNHIANFF